MNNLSHTQHLTIAQNSNSGVLLLTQLLQHSMVLLWYKTYFEKSTGN
ncbi:hypothetical protein lpymt_02455 [Legionella pneumophila]|nr:hypothetical protein lpymt_02455 [Legionella pneumophila]